MCAIETAQETTFSEPEKLKITEILAKYIHTNNKYYVSLIGQRLSSFHILCCGFLKSRLITLNESTYQITCEIFIFFNFVPFGFVVNRGMEIIDIGFFHLLVIADSV